METPAEVPSRWRGERLSRPPRHLGRLRSLLGMHVRETDPDVIRLRDGLLRGDTTADAFVAWSMEQSPGHGRQLFERAVEHGVHAVPGAPDSLVQWLEPLETEPAWLDHDLLRLACRTSWRVGAAGGTVLAATALMGGYRSGAAVKPLAMTGALERMVVRRLGETSRFTLDVVESETLSRFSAGFKSACRVRLMHAMVRHSLARRGDWDTKTWGVPINQTDMAGTQLEFSAIYLCALTALGYRFSGQERAAVMHLWRYVGYVVGVDDTLLAHDFGAGIRSMYIHAVTNPAADADSRSLAKALHELPQRRAKNPLEKTLAHAHTRYQTAVSRLTLGNRVADELGLPAEPLTSLLPLLSAGRFGIDTIRRLVPGATTLAERRGLAAQRRMTAALLGDERVTYVPYAERPRQGEAAA